MDILLSIRLENPSQRQRLSQLKAEKQVMSSKLCPTLMRENV